MLVTKLIVKGLARGEKNLTNWHTLDCIFLLGNSRFGKCLKGNSQNCKELQRDQQHITISFPPFCILFLCRVLFKNLEAVARRCSVILFNKEKRLRCFLVNFAKFLRTIFLQNTSEPVILKIVNPFQTNVSFPHPLKTSEKQNF